MADKFAPAAVFIVSFYQGANTKIEPDSFSQRAAFITKRISLLNYKGPYCIINMLEVFKLGTEMPAKRKKHWIPIGLFIALPVCGKVFFCERSSLMLGFKAELMDGIAMRRALVRISHEIVEKNKGTEDLCLIGIRRRGEPLARIIRENILKIEDVQVPCDSVDIKYYRDDLTRMNESPIWNKPELSFDVTGKNIVLVDDVLYTGRTARAAMEAVISCGRPRIIQLAVLVDRGHRELPIHADFVGKNVPTAHTEFIEVHIPPYDETTQVCLMDNN